jgi:hypothetical protein
MPEEERKKSILSQNNIRSQKNDTITLHYMRILNINVDFTIKIFLTFFLFFTEGFPIISIIFQQECCICNYSKIYPVVSSVLSGLAIQGDYKQCEQLHKFTGKKATATQNLDTHYCKE